MYKVIKKVLLSALSVLGVSFIFWTGLLLNPSMSYANHTEIGQVTIYHNQALEDGTELIIENVIEIISTSDIYSKELNIELCLNDDKLYPRLYPFAAATAYAFLNKTVVFASTPNFSKNYTEFEWEVNNYENRKYNLTYLLAHEFMHNIQHYNDPKYQILSTLGKINWKLEGHADYISRAFRNDGVLKEKITKYLTEESKEHLGVPVFKLEDGTIQNLTYFKYALVIQYLMEIKELDFNQISELEPGFDGPYSEMMEWYKK